MNVKTITMKKIKMTAVLLGTALITLIAACEKENDDIDSVSVTEASWYFGSWKEQGNGNILNLSQNNVTFATSSNMQYYASLKWYDAGDDDATVFFGHNTAGGYFQATIDGNTIPNQYYFNHEGEDLTISLLDKKVIKRYSKESTGTNSGSLTGNWERNDGKSYLKFSGSDISLCNGSSLQEFHGTYNSSTNKAVLIEGSTELDFEIYPEGSTKIRIEQYVSGNHLGTTYYYSSSKYPCSGGGGTAKTKVIFWNSQGYSSSWGWQVCIDGGGFPNCDAGGGMTVNGLASNYPSDCINYNNSFEVTPGTHSYDVVGQNRSWPIQSFTISKGQCLIVDVGESD